MRTAAIKVDGWLNLPGVRFCDISPAEHFYLHAIRFDEMFSTLVLPLRDRRSVRIEADHAEETATTYRRHLYQFQEVDVIVLEGIFLLKRDFQSDYDLSFWIECSFETALHRKGPGRSASRRDGRCVPEDLFSGPGDSPRA